jgi:hypothetical protein
MKRILPIIACTLGLNACAAMGKVSGDASSRHAQQRKLVAAVELQKEGKVASAAESLATLVTQQDVPGVTDEALFRLTLLYLRNDVAKTKGTVPAQQCIERLRREYPASPWTAMASPLAELLTTTAELRQQNRTLKNQNQSLAKDNEELRQSIEKLKRLDLELERKNR